MAPSHRLKPYADVLTSSCLGCVQEHDDSWVTDLPEAMHFVTPEWVSSCLAQGKLVSEHAHLISIARMVMLARLQVSALLCDSPLHGATQPSPIAAQLHGPQSTLLPEQAMRPQRQAPG